VNVNSAPPEVGRNEFDEFCWRRGVDLRAASKALGVSMETIRLIRLPFSDARRRVPAKDLSTRIYLWTDGQVIPAHFFPPSMRGRLATVDVELAEPRPVEPQQARA
jgi:hypothetical protein